MKRFVFNENDLALIRDDIRNGRIERALKYLADPPTPEEISGRIGHAEARRACGRIMDTCAEQIAEARKRLPPPERLEQIRLWEQRLLGAQWCDEAIRLLESVSASASDGKGEGK